MNTLDPRFVITLSAPVTFDGVGPFAYMRVEILDTVPGFANGYRFRPLRDARPEDSTEPEPVWVALGPDWWTADATPSEERALAIIEAHLAGPSEAAQLAAAKTALIARATHRRWEVEVSGVEVGGMPVATDDRSKTLLLQADREAREFGKGRRWKGQDGVWVPLTAEQVRAAAAAMSAHVDACFLREEELHDLINAAPDLAALNALRPTVETFTE